MTNSIVRPIFMCGAKIRQPISRRPFSFGRTAMSVPRSSLPSSNEDRPRSKATLVNHIDPRSYTHGRWLRNDRQERERRFIDFNFDALCKRAVALFPHGQTIVDCEKKEGGFNRAFIFRMSDNSKLVARLPTSLAGPARLVTNSEVATISYLRSMTSIPIPQILEWRDSKENPVGSEYVIMQHASGIQLSQKWDEMSIGEQIRCTGAITRCFAEMATLDFPAYGSLYFADANIDPLLTIPFTPGYVIGPHCSTIYWDCNVCVPRYGSGNTSASANQETWSSISSFCMGLFDSGLAQLPLSQPAKREKPTYYGSVNEHVKLLNHGRSIASALLKDFHPLQLASTSMLAHPDLHKRNIFVSESDPKMITGIIDWQHAGIKPAFMYGFEMPDFAAISDNSALDTWVDTDESGAVTEAEPASESAPEHESQEGKEEKAERRRRQIHEEACQRAFLAGVQVLVPKLQAAYDLDGDIIRFFACSYRTFQDGAAIFRQELINLSERWTSDLGLPGSCPYHTPLESNELAAHCEDADALAKAQQFRRAIVARLNAASDGWVPTAEWEEVREQYRELVDQMKSNMSEEDLNEVSPFDLDIED